MPRGSSSAYRSEALALPKPGFVAAAKNFTIGKAKQSWVGTNQQRADDEWQKAAWYFYDTIGEYRYSCDWVGSLISKAVLYPAQNGDATENQMALDAMASLFGGVDGQQEMLRQLGIQFTVAGGAYIVGISSKKQVDDDWYVIAESEMQRDGANAFVAGSGGDKLQIDKNSSMVVRLWRPHPRRPRRSNAPTRAVLPILSEIERLTMHVSAQVDSRLTSAGMLILPSQFSFPTVPVTKQVTTTTDSGNEVTDTEATASPAQAFADLLVDIASIAIDSPQDASAKVPLVIQVDGEYIDKVQYLKFWTDLDNTAIQLRQEAIRRLALGLDMPPEALEGVAGTNHWAAWQADESAIKEHSEPLLAIIVSSLTSGYLRPVLQTMGMSAEDAQTFTIEVDTSELRLRPNRSQEAIELWDRGALSTAAMIRENGFAETDVMGEEELTKWLTLKLAQGQTTPDLVAQALQMLGVDVHPVDEPAVSTHEARPTRSTSDHPVRALPNQGTVPKPDNAPSPMDPVVAPDVAAAAEMMVFRALERAGNRLKQRFGGRPPYGVQAPDLYLRFPKLSEEEINALMEDAWVLNNRFGLEFDATALTPVLDSYVRAVLRGCKPHDHASLVEYLSQSTILAAEVA